jgi:hypothetical protein
MKFDRFAANFTTSSRYSIENPCSIKSMALTFYLLTQNIYKGHLLNKEMIIAILVTMFK